jgi:hypothetical protein
MNSTSGESPPGDSEIFAGGGRLAGRFPDTGREPPYNDDAAEAKPSPSSTLLKQKNENNPVIG